MPEPFSIGKFFAGLVMLVVNVAFNALVLKVLWGWFVVTTFAAPQLTVSAAAGLALLVSFLKSEVTNSDNPHEVKRSFIVIMLACLGANAAFLFFGFVIHKLCQL